MLSSRRGVEAGEAVVQDQVLLSVIQVELPVALRLPGSMP